MSFLTPEDTFKYLPQLPKGSLAEFGVYHGDVMGRIIKASIDLDSNFDEVWGFDSWKGLPKEMEGVWQNPDWPEGAFSVQQRYGLTSDEDCVTFVTHLIRQYTGDTTLPLYFVSGFFDTSLTPELGAQLKDSVSYCHIDVDLYNSTREVLMWMFTHEILKIGALIRFDDWLYGKWAGNNKAFYEACYHFQLDLEWLGDNVFIYKGLTK